MDDIASTLIRMIPPLLVWVIGLVLSVKMLRRGGTKPEKLLVAGCSLILLQTILSPLSTILVNIWVIQEGVGFVSSGRTMFLVSIPRMIFSLAGFICLVTAFWIKFKVGKPEIA
ncbi:MAG: hypothetical protein JSU58_07355 [Dehalococcoidales bacterium]|nr:MAG: hypothetical protein JSU58_07355 [Dehalococcoidales bacterium]